MITNKQLGFGDSIAKSLRILLHFFRRHKSYRWDPEGEKDIFFFFDSLDYMETVLKGFTRIWNLASLWANSKQRKPKTGDRLG